MKVDLFTFIAQIINFLILVWLLKKLLYKPILSAIEEREKKIADRLKAAQDKEADAQKEQEELYKKNEEMERHKTVLLEKAEVEVNIEKTRLFNEVREDASSLRKRLNRTMIEEREKFVDEFINKIEREVFSISEKVLVDLSSVSIQDSIVEIFIKRLENMSDEDRTQIREASNVALRSATVMSAFEISSSQRDKIKIKIQESFQCSQFAFEIVPELIGGIDLIVNGYKIGWNIKNFMNSLKTFVDGNK